MSGVKDDNSSLLQAQSAVQNTYQAIDLAIDRRLAQVSLAYHDRDRLKTWLQTKVPLVRIADSSHDFFGIEQTNINDRDIDFDGFLPLELQFDLFSDPSHLNQFGAIEVSKYLAKRKEISW